ncbi:hypothetical protein AADR41_11010 [Streptomyces sp. CLV115]
MKFTSVGTAALVAVSAMAALAPSQTGRRPTTFTVLVPVHGGEPQDGG